MEIYKTKHIVLIFFICLLTNLKAVEGRPKLIRACLNPIDSNLTLSWYKPTDNCLSFTHFSLYGKEDLFSPFVYLAKSTDFSKEEINIKLKNLKTWSFYLVYSNLCNNIDSIYSDTILIDKTAPNLSELDSVSVDFATQKTILGWSKNLSKDNKGYTLYHVTSTNTIITNTENTFYLDISARNPTTSSIGYSIAAFDSCNNLSLISSPHRTIFLTQSIDNCKKTVSLNWTNYVGWNVDEYYIYLNINNAGYKKVGNVVSNINQFTYNFSSFGESLCFYIRAKKENSSITSTSNFVCLNTTGIISTKNSYVAKASVIDAGVELVCVTETGTSLEKIRIYKQIDNLGFNLWRTEAFSGGVFKIIDNETNVSSKNYSYYFETEGPCNLIFDTSQIAKTILLKSIFVSVGNQKLNWNLYSDFIKNTEKQEILLSNSPRFYSSTWNILNTNSFFTSYDDNTIIEKEQVCYCIRAIENNPSLLYNRKDTSYSNITCITSDPICFFPNAIQINGFNTEFKPVGLFIEKEKSTYQIFNRWGELIFESNNIDVSWNGKSYNGEYVQEGVYVYKAFIKGENGKELFFSGTITVLK